jgi:hypothetical protein
LHVLHQIYNEMIEFTFTSFKKILTSYLVSGYKIVPICDYFTNTVKSTDRILLLRHDVDRYPKNALKMAEMEKKMRVRASYYFRVIPSVYDKELIERIQKLGHEVSYHYEDLSLKRGNSQMAIEHFQFQLLKFREFAPILTICRHGSPLSKWDNKKLWEVYSYKDYGIICDTEFDIDYNRVFYITDNGMGWNKFSYSVRDKVETKLSIPIKNTENMIQLILEGRLPDQVMLNAHPDTFFDFGFRWIVNFLLINSKNIIKYLIVKLKIIK